MRHRISKIVESPGEGLPNVDLSATYLCNMPVKGLDRFDVCEEFVPVKILPASDKQGYVVVPIDESLYGRKHFYSTYLRWLLYTGYIIKK